MNCSSCEREMLRVFPDSGRRHDDFPQYDDALVVDLSGGYGMYIDPEGQRVRFVLCSACAIDLINRHPWMARAVEAP